MGRFPHAGRGPCHARRLAAARSGAAAVRTGGAVRRSGFGCDRGEQRRGCERYRLAPARSDRQARLRLCADAAISPARCRRHGSGRR